MTESSTSEKPLQIDLDEILRNKSKKRKVPKFIVNIIKRIVHQDEINGFLRRHHGKEGVDWSKGFLEEFKIQIETHGEENIPASGRFVFAANHPMGGTESHAFIKVISDHFEHLKIPSNDILMALKPMHKIFIPINKFGNQEKNNVQILNDAFASENQILIFPAGLASRRIKGEIKDLEWKKTFVTKAIQHQRDIIPVYIHGRNSNFFYRLANLRKFLRISFNIEMLFLPGEVLKQKGAKICLYFGEPISWSSLDKSKSHLEWTQFVREQVYSMRPK
jgi:putative hemolysin